MWPIINWHILFHLLIDTCAMDWFAYYGLVLWYVVAWFCGVLLLENNWLHVNWVTPATLHAIHLNFYISLHTVSQSFSLTRSLSLTRPHPRSLLLPHSSSPFFDLAPSSSLSLSHSSSPPFSTSWILLSRPLSLSYRNRRINGTIIVAIWPPFSTCKSRTCEGSVVVSVQDW
jgi:hypothetical protein